MEGKGGYMEGRNKGGGTCEGFVVDDHADDGHGDCPVFRCS